MLRPWIFVSVLSLMGCPDTVGSSKPPVAEAGPSSAELEAEAKTLLDEAKRLEDEGAGDPALMQKNLRKAAKLRAKANALMVRAKTRALAE